MNHSTLEKDKALTSVKKTGGSINKIQSMIEQDQYCPEIIQQIDAAIGMLNSAKKTLLTGHLNHCIEDKLKEDKQKAIKELIRIFDLD